MRIVELRPYWHRGTGWWEGRSAREQIMIGVLAALALLGLLLVLVVRPLESVRAQAVADIRSYDMVAMRLRAAGPAQTTAARRGPPSTIVAESAAAAGVTVLRLGPEGGKLNVTLGDAPFTNVLRFVSDLEGRSSLRIGEARIERSLGGAGQVTAQFVLAGG